VVKQVIIILTTSERDGLREVALPLAYISDISYLKIQREGSALFDI
jgi:hypothetical protein